MLRTLVRSLSLVAILAGSAAAAGDPPATGKAQTAKVVKKKSSHKAKTKKAARKSHRKAKKAKKAKAKPAEKA